MDVGRRLDPKFGGWPILCKERQKMGHPSFRGEEGVLHQRRFLEYARYCLMIAL
jgi:hypothetical protein